MSIQVDITYKDRQNGVGIVVCDVEGIPGTVQTQSIVLWMTIDRATKVIWHGEVVDFDPADPIHAAIGKALVV